MTQVAKVSTQLPSVTLNVPSASLPVLAGSLEVELSTIQAVISGLEKSIRRTEKGMIAIALPKMLAYCAEVFCGADQEKVDEVVEECTDFVISQFAGIGVPEVREAFKLAAAGKLGEVDIAAYRGKFTIKILGQVLGKYMEFREQAVRALRKAEAEAAEVAAAVEKMRKRDEMLVKHMDWCSAKLDAYIQNDIPPYDLIPVLLYDYLDMVELVALDRAAKFELMERAIPLVITSLVTEIGTENNEFKKKHLRAIVLNAQKGVFADMFIERQKTLAKQLAVMDFVCSYRSVIQFLTSLLNPSSDADAA